MSTVKKNTPSKSLSSQEIELDISILQEKLSKARDKEHKSTLLLRDRKLAQLSKANAKLKACREKKASVALKVKTKKTAASEKQLSNALNALSVANETLTLLKTEIQEIKHLVSQQKFALAKSSAAIKALIALDKIWLIKDPDQKKPTIIKTKSVTKTPANKPKTVKLMEKNKMKTTRPAASKPSKAKTTAKTASPSNDPQTSMHFSETASQDSSAAKPTEKNAALAVDSMQSEPGRSIFDPKNDM